MCCYSTPVGRDGLPRAAMRDLVYLRSRSRKLDSAKGDIAMLTTREQRIGLLEVIMYLMGIVVVVSAVAWNWDLVLLLALILVALPFLTYLEIRIIEHENDPSRRPSQTVAKPKPTGQKGTLHESVECSKA
jgi:hypothetical protein